MSSGEGGNRSTLAVPHYSSTKCDPAPDSPLDSHRPSISSLASSTMVPGGIGASLLSVRSSIQSSIRSVGIFLIAPFSKHRCCLGCVTLRDAIPLICVAEVVLLAMAAVIVLDLYLSDGKLFYTKSLQGRGSLVAVSFIVIAAISLIIHFLTLLAWRWGRPRFYLVHAAWQTILVLLLLAMFSQVVYGMHAGLILFASGCVICVFLSVIIFLELWWIFVVVDAAFFESYFYRRTSSRAEEDETNDMKHSSASKKTVPVVTVDCVSE